MTRYAVLRNRLSRFVINVLLFALGLQLVSRVCK